MSAADPTPAPSAASGAPAAPARPTPAPRPTPAQRPTRGRSLLGRALEAAESAADAGVDAVVAAGQSALMGEPHVELVRVSTVDGESGGPLDSGFSGSVTVTIAATVDGEQSSRSRTFYVA